MLLMSQVNLSGLGVALITPFKTDLSVDFNALENLIRHVIKGGCDYIVALGTTAETPTLSPEEKKEITHFIKEKVNGEIPLVIGIGGNSTHHVIKDILSRDLEGYSAILSVAPYYNKPTQEGLYQHFKAICEASSLPVILYNVPGRTGVNLTSRTTTELSKLSEKVYGIKEASGNIEQSQEIIKEAPSRFNLISGNDSDITKLMKIGAKGVISVLANAFPAETKKLVNLCREGKYKDAEGYQESLATIIKPLFEDGNPAGVKYVLSKMGLAENILRLPLVPVGETVKKKLDSAISTL